VPIEAVVKRHEGSLYIFAVNMRGEDATATFKLAGLTGNAPARVLGEDRTVELAAGAFRDSFAPWGVHLYQLAIPAAK
jgi:hypothetical protein